MTYPRPLRVWIVEDNPGDAELAKEYVLETGFVVKITTVDDGQQAIDLFTRVNKGSEERPDLVLLDLNLPKRSGHQVLEFIRLHDTNIKVIIYSGSKSSEDIKKAKLNKADDYLVKPMTAKEMDVVVKELRNTLASL